MPMEAGVAAASTSRSLQRPTSQLKRRPYSALHVVRVRVRVGVRVRVKVRARVGDWARVRVRVRVRVNTCAAAWPSEEGAAARGAPKRTGGGAGAPRRAG